MNKKQPEALRLAEMLTADEWPGHVTLVSYAQECVTELRRQHARITELESQLAQRFDAADVATASAQGFRDGVASVSAGSELVYQARYQKGFWQDSSRERYEYLQNPENTCADDWETRILYTHPSPPEGMAGWISVDERLPEKNTEVLICFAELSIPSTGRYTASALDHEGWCYPQENHLWPGERPDFEDGGSPTVTHWMPLPAAPGPADGEQWVDRSAGNQRRASGGDGDGKNLQRTAVGWQERALRAERNWVVCRRWAIAGGAPVEKLGDDPDQPFHAASPTIEGESNV